nr:unnamed protein product [Callosobruchus chinensis]
MQFRGQFDSSVTRP